MARKTLQLGSILSVLSLFSAPVSALPFAPIEPLSFSLGGTGVASAKNSNAGLLNPALLAVNERQASIALHAPMLGIRLFDRENMLDSLSRYQDIGVEDAYNSELASYKAGIYIDNDIGKSRAAIGGAASGILSHYDVLVDKPAQQEFMAAIVVGIPHEKLDMSFSLSTKMLGGVLVDVTDSDISELERIIDEVNGVDGQVLSTTESFDSSQFTSRLRGRGLSTTEFGVSIARHYTVAGHEIAVGITPKYIQATSFDYAESINTADFETDLGQKNESAIDVDLGAAQRYGNGWTTGIAIKNLIGQKYTTSLGNEIKIKPQARVGVSHAMKWAAVAVDLDLNKSESLGFDSETQYFGLGAELNIFDMSTVRIGYRHNMSDPDTSVATVGFGFKVYDVQIDLAAGANEDEIDVAAQAGFRF